GRDGLAPGAADDSLAEVGAELADAVAAAVPGWVERSVERLAVAWSGTLDAAAGAAARDAGARAAAEVSGELRRLLAADVDEQWTNPMTVVRRAVLHAARVLEAAGVGAVERSAEDEADFPGDTYGLTPRTFADVDPSLHELGIRWGATKARAHLVRHRCGGPTS
ncbi:MAG: hypothetical protein WD232_07765, partial [Acidimicrobiales bacterium]